MKLIMMMLPMVLACGAGESVKSNASDAADDAAEEASLVCASNCELNPSGDACTCYVDASTADQDAFQDVSVQDSSCQHEASKCDDDDKDCDGEKDHHHHLQWHGPF